jgi:aconitase B
MVKIYEGLEHMADIELERSAYAFSIRTSDGTVLEGVVYNFKNTDWRVMVSDGYQAKGFLNRARALAEVAKRYKLGKFADAEK